MTIVLDPRLAQSTAHQTLRRLLGRSTAREGVLLSGMAGKVVLWGSDALEREIEGGMSDGDYF